MTLVTSFQKSSGNPSKPAHGLKAHGQMAIRGDIYKGWDVKTIDNPKCVNLGPRTAFLFWGIYSWKGIKNGILSWKHFFCQSNSNILPREVNAAFIAGCFSVKAFISLMPSSVFNWCCFFFWATGNHKKMYLREKQIHHTPSTPVASIACMQWAKGGAHCWDKVQSGANQTAGFPTPLEPIHFWLYSMYRLELLILNGFLHKPKWKIYEWKKLSGPLNQNSKKVRFDKKSAFEKECHSFE